MLNWIQNLFINVFWKKKIIQHCFKIMISETRSRNWQVLLRCGLGQNCPSLFEGFGGFCFSILSEISAVCLELVSCLGGVLASVREQVRSHGGIHTGESGPKGRGQREA